ncbi:hypothetical protein PRIPAC_95693 [Pristionchus pacificus]|uniref:Uncharacterized protein n=1 Tax=Pristionchus pacificus TaxID=54126 RepID=A0A2A6D2N5_PRIPA|nr:hypothetical protein PRIPAC_95693 [Pristionchus pacificus]|eukprot:PDM84658.1 hypothetical protein PRIPAC_33681 [Pristionchus pacificus]
MAAWHRTSSAAPHYLRANDEMPSPVLCATMSDDIRDVDITYRRLLALKKAHKKDATPTSTIPSTTFRSMAAPTSPSSTASSMTTTPYCTPATTTTENTSLSQDPCVKQAFPALTNRTIGEYVCPLRNPDGSDGPMLVIRQAITKPFLVPAEYQGVFDLALTADGVIVTMANQKLMQVPGKYGEDEEIVRNKIDAFQLVLSRPTTFLPNAFPPSDFVCATVDSTKCPCDPCVPSPSMGPGTACTGPPALGSMSCPGTFWFTQNGQATKDHAARSATRTALRAARSTSAALLAGVYIRTATSAPFDPTEVLQACCSL